jgi:four helix bundle protein
VTGATRGYCWFGVLSFEFKVRLATVTAWPQFTALKTSTRGNLRRLRCSVYQLTRARPFSADFSLVDQIRRAAVSIGSNIAEGFDRAGNREFIQFLAYAKGSVAEVKDQLYCALDERYVTQTQFDETYSLAESTSRLIGGFMTYLRKSDLTGHKFDIGNESRNSKPKTQNSKPV